ncbi:NAD(P)/FAD-dependent oxidoreductase [bacterium]|nr:NAD(P)/FAD-dependent oxidoreductase [bacterium]
MTHACFEVGQLVTHYPRGHKQLRSILSRFGPRQTMDWFQERGVPLKIEADGRVFPISDSSQSIIDCLQNEAAQLGVEVHLSTSVKSISAQLEVETRQGTWQTRKLLLATGGAPNVYAWLQQLGHHMVVPVPSLFTFSVSDPRLADLPGVSVENVQARLETQPPISASGPLLVTHWGLSGPAILRLSAWGARALFDLNYQAGLRIDWLPDIHEEEVRRRLFQCKGESAKKAASDSPFPLPRRLWRNLVQSDLNWPQLADKFLNQLTESLKRCRFAINGKGVFKEEFVIAGGVPLAEIDLKTMQSKLCPGLYVAGELLDVDGLTGGFNFQNAWATGYLAGQAMTAPL